MTLQELKNLIENKTFSPTSLILVDKERFISYQYLRAIERDLHIPLLYIDSLEELVTEDDIFSTNEVNSSNQLYVMSTKIVDFCSDVLYNNNVIIITDSVDKDAKKFYDKFITDIPKIESWQIKDMICSMGYGLEEKYINWLLNTCGNNLHRLYNELLKISVFNESEKNELFLSMCEDGNFDDIATNSVFDFSNAIIKKDINALKVVYEEIDTIDVSEFGLLTILYNNFLNVINIQLGINPTAESLGMKQGQFNAIKYNCGRYSKTQLINIFKFLADIDLKIKSGQLDTKILIDYIVLSIMSM